MNHQKIRPYTMALYDLQDGFRAILKAQGAEGQGYIQEEPKMILKDDRTQELTFSIPMYIRDGKELVENPIWYNFKDGNLIVGMRKIKVIFGDVVVIPDENQNFETNEFGAKLNGVKAISNGQELFLDDVKSLKAISTGGEYANIPNEKSLILTYAPGAKKPKIFEFLITKVTESHKDGILMCDVECEGLAFHELGKTGYKISLNQDEYDIEYSAHFDGILAEVNPYHHYDWLEINEQDKSGYSLNLCFSRIKEGTNDYETNGTAELGLKIDLAEGVNTDKTYELQFFVENLKTNGLTWSIDDGVRHPLEEKNTIGGLKLDKDLELITLKFYKNGVDITAAIPIVSSFTLKQEENVIANIDYWTNKVLDNTKWEYEVQMDWSSYDGTIEFYEESSNSMKKAINKKREENGLRRMDKVYEDEFVSSWDENGKPLSYEKIKEKERIVEAKESNRFNIIQDISEKFEVNCKMVYDYDDYFRIIGRKVIYYNNFIKDKNVFDVTYPYDTSYISREIDCTDIVTKLFVKPIADDANIVSGQINISDAIPNRSREDYILNFDYLYDIGSISQDQYDEIEVYEKDIQKLNIEMEQCSRLISAYTNEIMQNQEAIEATSSLEIIKANDEIDDANKHISAIIGKEGKTQDDLVGISATILSSGMMTLKYSGIHEDTLKVYAVTDKNKTNNLYVGGNVVQKDSNQTVFQLVNYGDNVFVVCDFTYEPCLYYAEIVKTYTNVLAQAQKNKEEAEGKINALSNLLEEQNNKLGKLMRQKNDRMAQFERLMGPAIREGNWQDDEYIDMGNRGAEVVSYEQEPIQKKIYYTLDKNSFDKEQLLYFESGVSKDKIYYYYVKVNDFDLSDYKDIFLSYNDDWVKIPNQENGEIWTFNKQYRKGDICYTGMNKADWWQATRDNINEEPGLNINVKYLGIGSNLTPAIVNDELVLLITDETLYNDKNELLGDFTNLHFVKIESRLAQTSDGRTYYVPVPTANTEDLDVDVVIEKCKESDEIAFPRIKFFDMLLKDDENLKLYIGNEAIESKELEKYVDYSILPRYAEVGEDNNLTEECYCITIKPEILLKFNKNNPTNLEFLLYYSVSNAATSIYLDAKKVSKENAYPQVSYEVSINAINNEVVANLYDRLDQICHINDTDLKFHNVRGYVSEVELNLDNPWEDKITIKNYKSKFEDLFSSIVASTEQIKSNGTAYNRAASSFLSTGALNSETLNDVLNSRVLNYNFDKGNLTINEQNGIWATSEDGVVAMRGGGISVANEKDATGNWKWHTGITPNGINASLINAGQINLEKIFIYAGDNVAYQMNSTGLYAYRQIDDSFTTKEYVVHNGDGLFLTNKAGMEFGGKTLEEDINRVEISWDGLIIRNLDNEKVFYADNDGNLTIAGKIEANSGHIGDWIIEKGGLISDSLDFGIIPDSEDSVFWINGDENSFTIGSDGIVRATSILLDGALIADEATISGVPISELIKRNGIDKGIFKTELLGNVFKINALNEVNELKYIITAYDVDMDFENTNVYLQEFNDVCYEQYNFGEEEDYKKFDEFNPPIVGEYVSYEGKVYRCINNENDNSWIYKNIEDIEENYEQEFDEYLLFTLKYNVMNMEEQKVFRFMAEGEDGEIYYTENFTILTVVDGASPYVCKIEVLSGGTIFKNNKGSLSLIARVFDNLGEVDEYENSKEEYLFNYAWVNASEPEIVLGNEKIFSCSDISVVTTITCQVSLKD